MGSTALTFSLAVLSQAIGQIGIATASRIGAIRTAPNRHVTGLICQGDLIVTTDQALPAADSYTVVLPNRSLASARPGYRDTSANLALLRLDSPWPISNPEIAVTAIGNLLVLVGADIDSSPTVRLAAVHRFQRAADGPIPILDMAADRLDPGSLVLDANGRLVGLAAASASGEAMVIPSAVVGQMLMPDRPMATPPPSTISTMPQSTMPAFPGPLAVPSPTTAPPASTPLAAIPAEAHRRGWLGVALQPITVPDHLAARAGQNSGRMVVSLTKGGPAEMAGMRVGDVLLSLNGVSASGPQALRAFLGSERVGTTVEVRLLRDGAVISSHMTIAPNPA